MSETVPGRVPVIQGHNVWVQTAEGNIGKLRIQIVESDEEFRNILSLKIQWIYQPDPEKWDLSANPVAEDEGTGESG